MTQYTITEVANIMNINSKTLIEEVNDYENSNGFNVSMVAQKVLPIGTVNINNKRYFFGYECEDYCKNDDKLFNHIVLAEQCVTIKYVVNNSPQEQQVLMALQIDNEFVKRHGINIIWQN